MSNTQRSATRRRPAALGIASAAALAVVATLAGSSPAFAGERLRELPGVQSAGGAAPVVTRAALDPALVAGRGATVRLRRAGGGERRRPTARSSARTAPPTRCPPRRPAARAVKLTPGPVRRVHAARGGQRDHRALQHPGRARPAAASPRRSTSRSTAAHRTTMTLTSQYSWLYNQYPFSNDPNAGLLHPDWWITECGCVPAATTPAPTITTPFRPEPLLRRAAAAARQDVPGRRQGPAHRAGRQHRRVDGHRPARLRARRRCRTSACIAANVLLFGADPTGRRDSADAFDQADRVRQEARTSRSTSRRARTR